MAKQGEKIKIISARAKEIWKKDENGIEYQTDTRDEFGNYVTNSDPKSYSPSSLALLWGKPSSKC